MLYPDARFRDEMSKPVKAQAQQGESWTCHTCGQSGLPQSTTTCTCVIQRHGKSVKCGHQRCVECKVTWKRG
jgi:hypothetical protein